MPSWTKEQLQAINEEGQNIIVSAGAGSGKTAVLSERVLRKLKQGIDINRLLVLTFTNEAAGEMKNRIRKKIKQEPSLKKQLDYLDASYITTFDSYAGSIVKKYHYLLNIPKNITIIDNGLLELQKDTILDNIFESLYQKQDNDFTNLINNFCTKDDKEIKNAIKKINNSLNLRLDKDEYLDNYKLDIPKYLKQYNELLQHKLLELENILYRLSYSSDSTFYENISITLEPLLKSSSYDEIANNFALVSLPRIPKDSEDDIKKLKDEISKILKEFEALCRFSNEKEIEESLKQTEDYIRIIIKIIKEYDSQIMEFKRNNNAYEFTDIALFAIKIVKDNEEIRKELQNYYNEILVDEYQDTSDLQEAFINLIENNNVYMVGDIKQSIYRFRNANPTIFKNKYDKYANADGGLKIDLLKNFRSRSEVLNNINEIFNLIMDNTLGGAQYSESHQMVFGNTTYNEQGLTNQNNNLEIYNYHLEDKTYSKEEVEAFIIANDIKNKVDNHYQIFDKDTLEVKDITYSDICIIMDRGSSFPLYKKIFEYLHIPLSIYQDEKLTTETDIILIKNIINFILKIKEKKYDTEFKYYYTSIARSYLFSCSDSEIFKTFTNKDFYHTEIFKLSKEIADNLEELTNIELLNSIIDKFNIYEKTILVGDIERSMYRIQNLQNIAMNLDNLGYNPYLFGEYLKEMTNGNNEIRYSLNTKSGNNVKIMNIHKSKGLEFNICYFSGFHKEFNKEDTKDRFIYDSSLGIITPYYNEGIGSTILKDLFKDKYKQEDISERIRLFYVALTRCKEKMIMVCSLDEEKNIVEDIVDTSIRSKYKSFLDIINSIKTKIPNYIKSINLDDINLSKDYNIVLSNNYQDKIEQDNTIISTKEISIDQVEEQKQRASKISNKLISKEEAKNMEYGTYMHYIFETVDFNNPILDIEPFYLDKIIKFISAVGDIKVAQVYKEYEFIYTKDNKEYHGIIDLLLEYDDKIKIIDYKLKNTTDKAYLEQLKVYKEYVSSKLNKPVSTYLYSIIDEKLVPIAV